MNHLHDLSFFRDEDYLREIKAGGLRADKAISCLYRQYRYQAYISMKRLISRYPGYRGSPDDLVHDSFIVLIHKIQFEDLQVKSLSGFWIGIGKNVLLNQAKKDERTLLVKEKEENYGLNEDSPEALFLNHEELEQMGYSFSKFGSRCKEILLLWINQYSMVEIAQLMKFSNVAMARKRKYECFKKLKEFAQRGNKLPGLRHL